MPWTFLKLLSQRHRTTPKRNQILIFRQRITCVVFDPWLSLLFCNSFLFVRSFCLYTYRFHQWIINAEVLAVYQANCKCQWPSWNALHLILLHTTSRWEFPHVRSSFFQQTFYSPCVCFPFWVYCHIPITHIYGVDIYWLKFSFPSEFWMSKFSHPFIVIKNKLHKCFNLYF